MKYAGMPMGMWVLFAASFRRQLTAVFGYDKAAAASITKASKSRYKEIIARLPEFEREDQFRLNIVGCAMLCAFILSMPQRPEVDDDCSYAVVLPHERKKQVYRKGHCRHESHRCFESRRPQPVFLEHGFYRIHRRKRL